jgi:hypothetical protein
VSVGFVYFLFGRLKEGGVKVNIVNISCVSFKEKSAILNFIPFVFNGKKFLNWF